jgi:hypothetical protein
VSYPRFVELMPRALVPLCCYLHTRKGRCMGIACIDSTPLAVCHTRRIATHNDQWKNIRQIEHTRHRRVTGFMVKLLAGLVADS